MENKVSLIEENKIKSIKLANSINKAIQEEKDKLKNISHEERMAFAKSRYPLFYNTYPTVLRFMILEFMYTEKAFRYYLDEADKIHGKGMEELIELQCRFIYKLYVTYWKMKNRHYDATYIQKIVQEFRTNLKDFYIQTRKEEEKEKSEYEEKNKIYNNEKKLELLNFINNNKNEFRAYAGEEEDDLDKLNETLDLLDPWTSKKITYKAEDHKEIIAELKKYEDDLLYRLNKTNEILESVENYIEHSIIKTKLLKQEEFLKDTNLYNITLKKNKNKKQKSTDSV